jgi:hypothetical protein
MRTPQFGCWSSHEDLPRAAGQEHVLLQGAVEIVDAEEQQQSISWWPSSGLINEDG